MTSALATALRPPMRPGPRAPHNAGAMEGEFFPGDVVSGYQVEAIIGRGGMGCVYRARQLALDRRVALKVIATPHASDPLFRERFRREARVAASIEHAHVLPVFEAGESGDVLFLSMRLIDGENFAHLIRHQGPLAAPRAAELVGQAASALHAAHAHGVVHRDVKPANLLVSETQFGEHVYLADFGV